MGDYDLLTGVGDLISSISLFDMGTVLLWLIFSFVGGAFLGEKDDEKVLGISVFLLIGIVLFYFVSVESLILLVCLIIVILFGYFKILRQH